MNEIGSVPARLSDIRAKAAPPPAAPPPPARPTDQLAEKAERAEGLQQLEKGWKGVASDDSEQVVVAVIDDFVPEEGDQFNHGETIKQIVESGGAASEGALQSDDGLEVKTITYNVDDPNMQRVDAIRLALEDVLKRVEAGEEIDVVNLSQQATGEFAGDQEIDRLIQTLQDQHGVPVVVAAGNNGPDTPNRLAAEADIVVENSLHGTEERAPDSGTGNLRSEGVYTSQATANVSARAGQLQDAGFTPDQIAAILQYEAQQEGGSLDAAPNNPVFGLPQAA